MLEKIKQIKDLETIFNMLDNIDDFNLSEDEYAKVINYLARKYIEVENVYASIYRDEAKIINAINKNLETNSNVEITSKLNTTTMEKTARFYNFASYCIMAVTIYIVCLVLSSFHNEMINKRIVVSSMNYKKHNRLILGASFAYALIVWILYIVLGIILLGDVMFTIRGLIYVLNTLIFTFVALTLALLISTITNNKNAISGIVNVVALAQAFLCGAFIPTQWLPNSVLTIAHVLPAYWYINTNDILKELEIISSTTLKPVIINSIILILLFFVPKEFIAISFDAAGATTGSISVPLIISFGLGLISTRNDLKANEDSFGMIGICSIGPIITVLIMGLFYELKSNYIFKINESTNLTSLFKGAFLNYGSDILISIIPIIAVLIIYQIITKKYNKKGLQTKQCRETKNISWSSIWNNGGRGKSSRRSCYASWC